MQAIIVNNGLKIDMKNGTLGSAVVGIKIRIGNSIYTVPNFGDIPATYNFNSVIYYNIITNSIVLSTSIAVPAEHLYELCRWVQEAKKWIGNDGNIQVTLQDVNVTWNLSKVIYLSKANNVGYLVIDRVNKTITIPANLSWIYSDTLDQSWLTTAQVLNYSTLATSRTLYLYFNRVTNTFIFQRDNVKPSNTNDSLYFVTSFYNNVNNSSTISFNNEAIRVIENNAFTIKKIWCLGDSLTAFGGWQEIVKEIIGQQNEVINAGFSGSKVISGFPSSMSLRISTMPIDTDVLVFFGGTNDDASLIGSILPIGSSFDDTTFYGGYQKVIETAYSINPKVVVFCVVPPREYVGNPPSLLNKEGILTAVREVAKLYGIKTIDLDSEMGLNELNQNQYLIDLLHFTDFGKNKVGRLIGNTIKNNF
jgi:hypothetical protein